MPVVAIEISPQGQPVALAEALVEACSSGVREGECALVSDATSEVTAVAVVQWSDDAELSVVVRVDVRGGSDTEAGTRRLDFAPGDVRVERWRSVGLTIATLVGGNARRPRVQPADRTPRPAAPKTPAKQRAAPAPTKASKAALEPRVTGDLESESSSAPRAAAERRTQRLWTGLGAFLGPGLDNGGPRFGASFDVGWRPSELPLFFSPEIGYALASENQQGVSARWWSGGLWLGWVVPLGALVDLEPRLGARIERLEVAARQPPSALTDSGAHTSYGASLGADVVFRLGPLSPFAQLVAYRNDKATEILVAGRPVGTSEAAGWSVGLGLRGFLH